MALLAQVVPYITLPRKELLYCVLPIIQNYSILFKGGRQDEVCNLNWEGVCCYPEDD